MISSLAETSTALAPAFSAARTTFLTFSASKLSIPAMIFTALFSSKCFLNKSILFMFYLFIIP